jgi:hypothetical protein
MIDDLCQVLERLRERLQAQKSLLESNEAQTRVSLIDPLLRALGWPTDDPTAVQVEVRAGSGRADYLLRSGDQTILVLEVKKLGEKLDIAHSAAVSYAWELLRQGQAPRYVGVSDGRRWLLHEPQQLKQPRYALDLADSQRSIPALALAFTEALWRRLYTGGVGPSHDVSHSPDTRSRTSLPPRDAWRPLPELRAILGDPPPSRIRFPDGTEQELHTWASLLVSVAEWLVDQGKLTPAACPVPMGPRQYLVNTEPIHSTGRSFVSKKRLSNGLWLNLPLDAPSRFRSALKLLERFQIAPQQVLVSPRDVPPA